FCFENSSSELQENLKFLFSDHLNRNQSMLEEFEIFDKSTEHIYGWESWYNYYTNVNEKVVIENLEKLPSFFNKKTVFQIDDGWEKVVGQWEQDIEKFPTPLEKLSDTISKSSSVPGIWIAPLALLKGSKIYHEKKDWVLKDSNGQPVVCGNVPLWGGDFYTFDLSIEDVRDFIVEQVDLLIEKYRFSYIKLDFLYCGLIDGKFTNTGHGGAYYYNLFMEELVKKVNNRAILLGCGAFLQLSFPYFQVMRIGADTKEQWEYPLAKIAGYEGRPSAYMSLTDTIARLILNKSVFFSDPDVCFFRKSNTKLNDDEKFLINIVNYIAGSQIMISDDLDDIDMNLKEKVFAFYEFLNLKNFCIRRYFKKDLYFLYDDKKQIFGFINLSNKKYTFTKADFKLIFYDHEISKLFVYDYDFEKKIYQSEVENICIKPHQIIFFGEKNF
ncbi:MAG TPA: alpha-galactosidase, partial [Exilispira sp.]|nr:alpha-galactosidase [Exilispira sp.]